jgi:hypothetical protein
MSNLTPEQKQQIGELFIDVSRLPQAEREQAREQGVALFEALMPSIEKLVFEAGIRMPRIAMIEGSAAPVLNGSREMPMLVVSLELPHDDNVEKSAVLLKEFAQTTLPGREDFLGGNKAPMSQRLDRSRGEDANPGFGRGIGGRGTYDMEHGPDKNKARKNTWGDLRFYGRMRTSDNRAERAEWEFWRDHLFNEKTLKDMPWKDWLRSLRVLNGISNKRLAAMLKYTKSGWVNIETESHVTLPLTVCIDIINRNLFNLPTDKSGGVKRDVAEKFAEKTENGPEYRLYCAQPILVSSIKASAIETASGTCENPKLQRGQSSRILRALNGGAALPREYENMDADARLEHLKMHLPDYNEDLQYMGAIFMNKANPLTPSYPTNIARKAAEAVVFDLLEQSPSVKKFLAMYRAACHEFQSDVQKRIRKSAVEYLEKRDHFTSTMFENLKEGNPYGLPTDETGAIHPEIIYALETLNAGEKYTNPFMNIAQVAREMGIEPWQEEGAPEKQGHDIKKPWTERLSEGKWYVESATWEAFKTYWREREAEWKNNGHKLTIGKDVVMTWQDPYGRMLVHENDFEMMAKDPRWLKAKAALSQTAGAAR